jgi:glyoxylase-like metal-dependent hydrolase (beta-lactamase superfamily II)
MTHNQVHYPKSRLVLIALFVATFTAVFMLGIYLRLNSIYAQAENVSVSTPSEGVTIHQYESPKMDSVNLYWLETDEGIVLVDTGRFLSQARYALKEIRTSTDKPILGILVTHPHTDHYAGLPVFVQAAGDDVPIYASQITYDDIKTDRQGFIKLRNELHGNDFPNHNEIPLPNRIVKDGEEIRLGGLTFRVIELPKNETLVTTLYHLPKQSVLFAGDIVTNKSIPFLADGNSGNWIAQLEMLLARYPDQTVYSGHGKPGLAKDLIREESEYIETLRSLVGEALKGDASVTPQEKADIVAEMEKRHPDYQTSLLVPNLLERGIDGIAKELTQEST